MNALLKTSVGLAAIVLAVLGASIRTPAPVRAENNEGNIPDHVSYWVVADQLRVCNSSHNLVPDNILNQAIAIWNTGVGATILVNSCTNWGTNIIDKPEGACSSPIGDALACTSLPSADSPQPKELWVETDAGSGDQLASVVAHELGHNLGFNHTPVDGTSCNPDSIMTPVVCSPPVTALQPIDKTNFQNGYHVDAVTSFSGYGSGTNGVVLNWDPSNIDNEKAFLVNWLNPCTGQWQIAAAPVQNASTVTLSGQQGGLQQYEILGLTNALPPPDNAGEIAGPTTVTVLNDLNPPSSLTSTFPSTTVDRFTWPAVTGAHHYKVRVDLVPTGSFAPTCFDDIQGTQYDWQYDSPVPLSHLAQYYATVMECDASDVCSQQSTTYTLTERFESGAWHYVFTYYRSGDNINFQFINFNPNFMALKLHIRNGDQPNSPLVTDSPCVPTGAPPTSIPPMSASFSFSSGKLATQGHGIYSANTCAATDSNDSSTVGWGYIPPPGGSAPPPGNGLWDMEIGPGVLHCIARTDTDPVTLALSATAQCYSENNAVSGLAGVEPPCDAVHLTAATPVAVVPGEGSCDGHVAPPPYTSQPPVMFTGSSSYTGCLADVGGSLGPNVIVQLSALGAPATAKVYPGQTNANCTAGTPSGSYSAYPTTMTGVNPQRDSDGDGCTDEQELWAGTPGGSTTCGDDPWNPYDTPSGSPLNVTGSWDIVLEKTRADVGAQGYYYECKSDIAQSGSSLTAPILCYVDNPGVTVNLSAAGGTACPPAAATFCGDGLPGAAPPGCAQAGQNPPVTCATLAGQDTGCPSLPCDVSQYEFAPVTSEASLTGSIGGTPATISLSGCHPNLGGNGDVYIQAKINAYTGLGYGNVYINQPADCAGSPTGATNSVRIFAARQSPGVETVQTGTGTIQGCLQNGNPPGSALGYANCRDSDGDGCPDKVELSNASGLGGLRDPLNRWDYFNPEKVNTPHSQTVADILRVVGQFGKNQGNPAYTIDTDRTAIIGGNVWTLGPPDGQQTVADTLAAIKQYNQNC